VLTSPSYALEAVPHVDLARYLGTWYEIAKYPNVFQKDCVVSKADYSLLQDGVIEVNNRCIETNGKIEKAMGRAYVDATSSAKLKVQFFLKFLNLSFLQGDYWIIKLDSDYRYAIVSEPSQKYLWILSRTPTMDDALYQELLAWLHSEGFDISAIIKDDWSAQQRIDF
jgi:apolipoprotein D and lipocalin family protein